MFDWLADPVGKFYCQLGEVTGIGATSHLLRISGKTLLIDSGVAISRNGNFQVQGVAAGNFLVDIPLGLIVITHAHLDHFGAIARLIRHHPETKVVVSKSALAAIAFMLSDSLKIMESEQRQANRVGVSLSEPLFYEIDRLNFLSNPNMVAVDLPVWLDVENVLGEGWAGWKIGFHDSGHDTGAMMTFIVSPDDRRYLVTGDVCSHDQIFRSGVMLPGKEFTNGFFDRPELLTMITEATNGTKPMVETPEETLVKLGTILKEVEARDGFVLIAAFSKNRCSKMAMGCIELGFVPVVDGSGRTMMRIELGNEFVDELIESGKLIFIDENTENPDEAREQRESLLSGKLGFHPIIAPSGTLEGGYSVSWAEEILPGSDNAIIFPGYLFPDSTSRQIFEMNRGHTVILKVWDKVRRRTVPTPVNVRCDVHHLDFTSHDKRDGLVERVRLAKPNNLIVHHCDDEAFEMFATVTNLAVPHLRTIERGSHLKVIEL